MERGDVIFRVHQAAESFIEGAVSQTDPLFIRQVVAFERKGLSQEESVPH